MGKEEEDLVGQVASAVPYKKSASGKAKYLVVRARGCKTWTLPKGHVKERDLERAAAVLTKPKGDPSVCGDIEREGGLDKAKLTLAFAARRETKEEAGVIGCVHPEPLGTYMYGRPGKEKRVTAFLLKFDERVKVSKKERWRTPKWRSYGKASKLLKKGRPDGDCVGDGHKRILDAAKRVVDRELNSGR